MSWFYPIGNKRKHIAQDHDGTIYTKLTGSNVELKSDRYDQDLNTSGSKTFTIIPPDNELWRIKSIRFNIPKPVGATSGTHLVIFYLGEKGTDVLEVNGRYEDDLSMRRNVVISGNGRPESEEAQQSAVLNMVVSKDCPLQVSYVNGTDATNDGTLDLRITREVVKIVV